MATIDMSDRKVFHDSVTAIQAEHGLTVDGLMVSEALPEHRTEKMTLHFSLDILPRRRRNWKKRSPAAKLSPQKS